MCMCIYTYAHIYSYIQTHAHIYTYNVKVIDI